MNNLASCFLQHGAPSAQSFKSFHVQRSPSLHSLERRSVSMPRSRTADHAATAANATIGPHANTQGVDVTVVSGTSFDFERYLSAKARAVHDALDLALQGLPCPEVLSESMRYSVLAGGKRVCPVVAIAACELVGGPAAAAVPVACALEMIHTASLIHDDMSYMDDGALRRGRPSNHVAFGEPTALLAGDALLALAFEHVARGSAGAGAPADRALRAIVELGSAAGVGGIAAGQVVDMASEGAPSGSVSLAALEYIHVHKTARLVEAAAVSGAVVGGGADGEVERIRRYAHFLGLLHQVVDDLLDVTGTPEHIGKMTGKDAAAGKATYPRLMGMEGTRAYMGELLAKAEAELDGFDAARVAPLRHLARFMAYRQH
ncbi:geranylgeranyl pyrophosphate synthase 7, chloroplastic-like [Miscanthus floridulus]|uniref:geranylgeranyl pyrophosphate synthase 7, chloroplastic-like n=1 Tax=Miscanthus floridulus TaxID=154761 RepID=UPI00345989D7